MSRGSPGGRLRVLQSIEAPSEGTNAYLTQLMDSLAPLAQLRFFSWKAALFGRYDVLHLHWPDALLFARSRWRRSLKYLLVLLLQARLRCGAGRLVRTVHNTSPHEGSTSWFRDLVLRNFDSLTRHEIHLREGGHRVSVGGTSVIPHGHYRDFYASYETEKPSPASVAYFGLIRPYKRLENLLTAFAEVDCPSARLSVAGSAIDGDYLANVERLCRQDQRIRFRPGHLPDDELVRLVTSSQLIVLPYPIQENSGAILLALSLGARVLTPLTDSVKQLADEVGSSWILGYEGELTGAVLGVALETSAVDAPNEEPDLSARDWRQTGAQHIAVYAQTVMSSSRRMGGGI